MNAHDKDLGRRADDIAVVRYGDGEFVVLRPGRFVICAVSGKRIALEALRYWNPGRPGSLRRPGRGPGPLEGTERLEHDSILDGTA